MELKNNAFNVDDDIDLFDCLSLYQGAYAAICTRLHGNVFAALQDVPVIGINYNPKVLEFYKWIGFDEFSIDINDLNSNTITNKLNKLIQIREKFIYNARARLKLANSEIEKYADIAVECLK